MPITPPLGYFVIYEIELAKICPCTKFEVSSFTRSKFMERIQNSEIQPMDPDHALCEGILSSLRLNLSRSIPIPNLKFTRSKFTITLLDITTDASILWAWHALASTKRSHFHGHSNYMSAFYTVSHKKHTKIVLVIPSTKVN